MKYIAVDLGGTNTVVAIVESCIDASVVILSKKSCSTNTTNSAESICKDIVRLSMDLLHDLNLTFADIQHIGLGVPGAVDPSKYLVSFSNNLRIKDWDIKKMLMAAYMEYTEDHNFAIKIFVENDANAAAYGEFIAGSLRACRNAMAITIGTGIGCGLIVNGEIYSGYNNAAGEIGHMVIKTGGRQCSCGRKGCWEQYASASALALSAQEAMAKDKKSLLWEISGDISKVDGKAVFDAAERQDKTAQEVLNSYFLDLSCGLINIINILQPEKICLGGGISKQGDNLLVPIRKIVAKEVYSRNCKKNTQICIAELGNDAGLIGAALIKR